VPERQFIDLSSNQDEWTVWVCSKLTIRNRLIFVLRCLLFILQNKHYLFSSNSSPDTRFVDEDRKSSASGYVGKNVYEWDSNSCPNQTETYPGIEVAAILGNSSALPSTKGSIGKHHHSHQIAAIFQHRTAFHLPLFLQKR